jgi:hypothetical protein
MRHQRAAAGWSSGRGPAAAADRTIRVASRGGSIFSYVRRDRRRAAFTVVSRV